MAALSRHAVLRKRILMRRLIPAVALAAGLASAAGAQAQPPTGVYACYEARYQQGAPGCVNSGTGILSMTDGSLHGVKYKRVADWSFRKLDDAGKETAFTCPLDPKKNIQHRPW